MRNGEIIFNGRSSLDLNLFLEDYPSIPSLNEEYETEKVLSMDGELHYGLGTYPDREITLDFDLVSDNLEVAYRQVEKWLSDIEDDRLFINSDKCFRVKKIIRGEFEKENYNTVSLPITFLCYSYRYDAENTTINIAVERDPSGLYPTSKMYKIINYGDFVTKPKIELVGRGYVEIEVINGSNDTKLIIENMPSNTFTINSELETCIYNVLEKSGDYPAFAPGVNYLRLNFNTINGSIGQDGNVETMKITFNNRYR